MRWSPTSGWPFRYSSCCCTLSSRPPSVLGTILCSGSSGWSRSSEPSSPRPCPKACQGPDCGRHHRWSGQRTCILAQHPDPVPVHLPAGGFRLHGQSRLHHGQADAQDRPARQVLHPDDQGFGCNVPAIMATRTIENRKSRLITMLIIPMMSCAGRLPVYILVAGAFFPRNGSLVLLASMPSASSWPSSRPGS